MNQPPQGNRHGPVAAFFVFIWDAMNFVRRLTFNLLFFGLLLVLLIAMAAAGRIKPSGSAVRHRGDVLRGGGATRSSARCRPT